MTLIFIISTMGIIYVYSITSLLNVFCLKIHGDTFQNIYDWKFVREKKRLHVTLLSWDYQPQP